MTEQIIVPEYCIVPLQDEVQIKDACLVEPLAVAFHGLIRTETKAHHRVAIVGAGSIGLSAVAAARYIGCEVGLHAKYDHQMEAGQKLGASPIKGTYDRVIECAGASGIMEMCHSLANPAAWVILLSVYWDEFNMPGISAFIKELKIFPSMMYGQTNGVRDIDEAAKILAKNPQIGETIISHRFPLEAAKEAFDTAQDRKSGAIKVVFDTTI
jgi:threonine dehydrogenase-like Zn-dependent dehydrogenase